MIGIDAAVSLISLLAPKVIQMIQGVIHRKDSPAQVLSTLAQTNPDAMAKFIEAQAKLIEAQNASINADIYGTVWEWVGSVRALIRPAITVFGILHIAVANIGSTYPPVSDAAMIVYETAIGSWFGSRMCD